MPSLVQEVMLKEIASQFEKNPYIFISTFQGIVVADLSDLRRRLEKVAKRSVVLLPLPLIKMQMVTLLLFLLQLMVRTLLSLAQQVAAPQQLQTKEPQLLMPKLDLALILRLVASKVELIS